MNSLSIIIILSLCPLLFAQSNRYTKGAENGYAWYEMEKTQIHFNTSKETYLSAILQRFNLMQEKYPELESLSCKDDIELMQAEGKSDEISLEDVVIAIDNFYLQKNNLIIPIIFSYCYCIKEMAGVSKKELTRYKNEVMKFCGE